LAGSGAAGYSSSQDRGKPVNTSSVLSEIVHTPFCSPYREQFLKGQKLCLQVFHAPEKKIASGNITSQIF
jgi:hypothetical protein